MSFTADLADSQKQLQSIKQQHIKTLAELWPSLEAVQAEESLWGDEVEYLVFRLEDEVSKVHLSLRCSQILKDLDEQWPQEAFDAEAYQYMLESQPRQPYGDLLRDLACVEQNMRARRQMIRSCLESNERVATLTNVATLGSSQMRVEPRSLITKKKRYQELLNNIPGRASDSNGNYDVELRGTASPVGHKGTSILLDDPIYGAGGCGLQMTFSARDLEEACELHDQLIPLGPLMLALSAATPIYKGRLVATDTRWAAQCMACDDRKSQEKTSTHPRWGCTPMYLAECSSASQLNGNTLQLIEELKPHLHDFGLPNSLATYFTHILGRDPLIEVSSMPDTDDTSQEALRIRKEILYLHTSTWWSHVRLKLPVISTDGLSLPWRVEFRPVEVQPTDKENAALVVGTRLLHQTIQHYGLDLKIPISAVEDNMERASSQGAIKSQIFWFSAQSKRHTDQEGLDFEGWASLNVIFNGGSDDTGRLWTGFIPLAKAYFEHRSVCKLPETEREQILDSLRLISARASGDLKTPATWMRNFVKSHSHDELHDKEVSSSVYYAMVRELSE